MSTPETAWNPTSVESRLAALEARVRELEARTRLDPDLLASALRALDRRERGDSR